MESSLEFETLKADRAGAPQAIVVPVDGSAVARHAADLAHSLAQRSGARLHLLHVKPLPIGVTAGVVDDSIDLSALDREVQTLEHQYREWALPYGAHTHIHIRTGELIETLAQVCAELAASLVVMGTAGDHGWHEWLVGTNAEQVLHHIRTPLLSLKCDRSRWSLRNLLVINDFQEQPPPLVPTLKWLADLDGATVHLLKVGPAEAQLHERMDAFARQQGLKRVPRATGG